MQLVSAAACAACAAAAQASTGLLHRAPSQLLPPIPTMLAPVLPAGATTLASANALNVQASAQQGWYLLQRLAGMQMLGGRQSPAPVTVDVLVSGQVLLRGLHCSVREVRAPGKKPYYRLHDLSWQLPDPDWLLISAEAPADAQGNWQLHMQPPGRQRGGAGAAAGAAADQATGGCVRARKLASDACMGFCLKDLSVTSASSATCLT
jgi:hypothetical protein